MKTSLKHQIIAYNSPEDLLIPRGNRPRKYERYGMTSWLGSTYSFQQLWNVYRLPSGHRYYPTERVDQRPTGRSMLRDSYQAERRRTYTQIR